MLCSGCKLRILVSVKVFRPDHQYLYAVYIYRYFFFFRTHVSLGAVVKGVKKW